MSLRIAAGAVALGLCMTGAVARADPPRPPAREEVLSPEVRQAARALYRAQRGSSTHASVLAKRRLFVAELRRTAALARAANSGPAAERDAATQKLAAHEAHLRIMLAELRTASEGDAGEIDKLDRLEARLGGLFTELEATRSLPDGDAKRDRLRSSLREISRGAPDKTTAESRRRGPMLQRGRFPNGPRGLPLKKRVLRNAP